MLGDRHPSTEHKPDPNKIKRQLDLCSEFAQKQVERGHQHNTVFLVEQMSASIAQSYIRPGEAYILNDMSKIAEDNRLNRENVDFRAETLAAGNAIQSNLKNKKINKSLSFGPTQDLLKRPSLVTLDGLFEEKERYIEYIKQFSWSKDEQKEADRLHKVLFDALQGWDLSETICTFCENTSSEIKREIYKKMGAMSLYLFDKYATKKIVDYSENRNYTVLFVAGFTHVSNVKDQLVDKHNWDYQVYYDVGDPLSNYNLKSTLGITTWWDRTKNCFGYVD